MRPQLSCSFHSESNGVLADEHRRVAIYRTQENFGRGKFWQTIQVKAILARKSLANKLKSVHIYVKYIFGVAIWEYW